MEQAANVERMLGRLRGQGMPWVDALAEGLQRPASVSVRLNPGKAVPPPLVAATEGARPVPWCAGGLTLPERPRFTYDPELHQGRYYVQEASSMFVSHVVAHLAALLGSGPLSLLDTCAAPGGKTLAAYDALPPGSTVAANEYVASRCSVLRETVAKWGIPVEVTNLDTGRLRGAYDIVLVDAPCSGEGMMRKESAAVAQWNPRLIEECAARQRMIIDNVAPLVRPGGYLIYSTCTFNRDENEDIVSYIAREHGGEGVAIPLDPSWGVQPGVAAGLPCCRFIPGVAAVGEGLFMAALQLPGSPGARPAKKGRRGHDSAAASPLTPDEQRQAALMARGAVPDAPTVEVDLDTALAYLRRQAVTLADDAPRGPVVLTYRGLPLGHAKNLGNRANNPYPSAWRIRN